MAHHLLQHVSPAGMFRMEKVLEHRSLIFDHQHSIQLLHGMHLGQNQSCRPRGLVSFACAVQEAPEGLKPEQGYPKDASAENAAEGGVAGSLAPVAAAVASGKSEEDGLNEQVLDIICLP